MSRVLVEDIKEKTYEEIIGSLIIKKTIKSPLPISLGLLSDGFAEIERGEIRVAHILLNARTYSGLRIIGKNSIDLETHKENLQKGIIAYIWGATIIVSEKIPDNTTLILSEKKHNKATLLLIEEQDNITELIKLMSKMKVKIGEITKLQIRFEKLIYNITKTEE